MIKKPVLFPARQKGVSQAMHVFYSDLIEGNSHVLDKEESHHCVRVLRLRTGDKLFLTDGKGLWCTARLEDANPRASRLTIEEQQREYGRRSFHLHVAIAPTKQIDRFEWFLEKATECGIDEITPVLCQQSERRVIKPERLQKVIAGAMKQSMRAYLPRLNPALSLQDFLGQELPSQAFIAHCGGGERLSFQSTCKAGEDVVFLVGPEGDFSEEEVSAAMDRGFQPITLGPHRLRTETAALVLCVQANSLNQLI